LPSFFAEIVPAAAEIDPASALRGSLGVSLGDLSLSSNFGRVSLLLNGGFALLFGTLASLAFARHRPLPRNTHEQTDDRSVPLVVDFSILRQ
jgi:hypothetical protein